MRDPGAPGVVVEILVGIGGDGIVEWRHIDNVDLRTVSSKEETFSQLDAILRVK